MAKITMKKFHGGSGKMAGPNNLLHPIAQTARSG
jgi:hypothetical protein